MEEIDKAACTGGMNSESSTSPFQGLIDNESERSDLGENL
jgi:hypothetical protein